MPPTRHSSSDRKPNQSKNEASQKEIDEGKEAECDSDSENRDVPRKRSKKDGQAEKREGSCAKKPKKQPDRKPLEPHVHIMKTRNRISQKKRVCHCCEAPVDHNSNSVNATKPLEKKTHQKPEPASQEVERRSSRFSRKRSVCPCCEAPVDHNSNSVNATKPLEKQNHQKPGPASQEVERRSSRFSRKRSDCPCCEAPVDHNSNSVNATKPLEKKTHQKPEPASQEVERRSSRFSRKRSVGPCCEAPVDHNSNSVNATKPLEKKTHQKPEPASQEVERRCSRFSRKRSVGPCCEDGNSHKVNATKPPEKKTSQKPRAAPLAMKTSKRTKKRRIVCTACEVVRETSCLKESKSGEESTTEEREHQNDRESGATYDGDLFEVAPKLAKCRECRWMSDISEDMPDTSCRFHLFRKLENTENGLVIAGFSDSHMDALKDDYKLWLPNVEIPPSDLDLETCKLLLAQLGDTFCGLLMQEKEAYEANMSNDKNVVWRRVIPGVRDMCDVCATTLFNYHWTCDKCGFVVCLDCYQSRKNGTQKSNSDTERDEFKWLYCSQSDSHKQEMLMLSQIIPNECLIKLGKMVHEMRELWSIEQFCGCPASAESKLNNVECRKAVERIISNRLEKDKRIRKAYSPGRLPSPVPEDDTDSESEEETELFRSMVYGPSYKPKKSFSKVVSSVEEKKSKSGTNNNAQLLFGRTTIKQKIEAPKYISQKRGKQQAPIRIMTLPVSNTLYPGVPHSWLCNGKVLMLNNPNHKGNEKPFQDSWNSGQPVIVSNVCRSLDKDLWSPESFARDFGDERTELINCMTGDTLPNQLMGNFWKGFIDSSKQLKDVTGRPMLLKLKDWPSSKDFAEMLPSRFENLMKALPMQAYTRRNGKLNLVSRLPDCFVKPDLGPKMYNAYGLVSHPRRGTTNLHLDMSDAVNVMVYVGMSNDDKDSDNIREVLLQATDDCDFSTRRRVSDKRELPGALWHIYNASDTDKIRDFLNKVAVESGEKLEPYNDTIHDQRIYLDRTLRDRLYREYGVEGYGIVQCLGDAVFIPAGAPHQVQNFFNCIKVAEDFVSPENVDHCFHLTQEFRELSDTHSNHEDKLQIKNIVYHALKDVVSALGSIMNRESGRRLVFVDIPGFSDGDSM